MDEKRFSAPIVGGSSLLVIFAVLCLTVFALLGLSTVQAGGRLSEASAEAVSAYYAGDYFTMCDAQADSVDLQFYYPDETNYFIDAMCIPSCCQDQELAECFINFMLSREAAVANAEYIYYASPNRLVYDDPEYIDDMGEDTMAILYPDIGSFRDAYNRSAYRNLDQDTLTYVNTLWETLKIN